jgi:hypothetical protein
VADEDVDDKLLEQYEKAYQALSVDDPEARHLIEMLETKYPNDPLVKLHARRIEAGESGTTLIIRKK